MVTDFFKKNIANMLTADNKTFSKYADDLGVLDLLVEKSKKGKQALPEDIDLYKSILEDELFHYKTTNEETELILTCFKNNIKNKTAHAVQCTAYIERLLCEGSFRFLFEELKKSINSDIYLSVALLNNCTFFVYDDDLVELLIFLKMQLQNNSLPTAFKRYMQDIIDFHEGRRGTCGAPVLYYDEEGNNRKIYWE